MQSVSCDIYVHPQAICDSGEVGSGTRIWAFAQVMAGASIGEDCNIAGHVFIEDGAKLGDRVTVKNHVAIWDGITIENDVFIGPAVTFTNDRYPKAKRMAAVANRYSDDHNWLQQTRVCHGASIGGAAVILPGVTIGPFAMVGAGAVVTRSIPAHGLVLASKARIVGWACACGRRLNDDFSCAHCGRRYQGNGESIRLSDEGRMQNAE